MNHHTASSRNQHRRKQPFFLILCIAGLLVNYLLAHLATSLKLPLYLDNIGSALAAALGPGLFASARAEASGAQAPQAEASALAAGALLAVDLDAGEAVFDFVAPSGSVYDVWLFPAEDEPPQVTARLWRGGVPRLIAGQRWLVPETDSAEELAALVASLVAD